MNAWSLPPDTCLHFGKASGVLFTAECTAVGSGATGTTPGVKLHFCRSSLPTSDIAAFQDMNVSPIWLSRAQVTTVRAFGADGVSGDGYPRGLGNVRLVNTSAAWAAVRLRVWYALQD